jgi:hypothetical protein
MPHDEIVATLIGAFSVFSLILAAIGLEGVMSYNVVRTTNEMAFRLWADSRRLGQVAKKTDAARRP